jgi:hypothetical protein
MSQLALTSSNQECFVFLKTAEGCSAHGQTIVT